MGWAILLDYLFLPLVIWLIGGSYLQGQFPNVPFFVWIVAFIVITSALNVIGLKVADRTNFVLMTVQLLILAFFVIPSSITHLVSDSQSLVSARRSPVAVVSRRLRPVPRLRRTRSLDSTPSAR
ncbi:MAG: putrescine importer [Mycobacterium sp.]|nr:putrescine importer [Mycobacterium sp.]